MDVRERPVLDSNDAITVTHSLKLIHMFMNEETDVVSMHVWEEMVKIRLIYSLILYYL